MTAIDSNLRTVEMSPCRTVATIQVPTGWDEVQKLVGRVLTVDGVAYGFTGWNSDLLVAYFKRGGITGRLA